MPRKPQRGCAYGRCPKRADGNSSYCKEHKKLLDQHYDRFIRSPETRKNYGSTWRRTRSRYARLHPFCERCLKEGRLTPVEEVHHILPVSQGGGSEEDNLMSLCQSCHTKIHHELGDRRIRR